MKNLMILSLLLVSALPIYAQEILGSTGIALIPLGVPADKDFAELRIKVLDFQTLSPMNSTVDIFYFSDFIKSDSGKTASEHGEFNTRLTNFGLYNISISAPGYFEATHTIWVANETSKNIEKEFYMIPTSLGMNVALSSFNFDFGKTGLTEESFVELDKMIMILNQNRGIVVEIASHTDNQGSNDYNLVLSQWRALAVVNYLVGKGVDRSQLEIRGYGEAKPLDDNETKSGRENNNRIGFTVITTGIDQE